MFVGSKNKITGSWTRNFVDVKFYFFLVKTQKDNSLHGYQLKWFKVIPTVYANHTAIRFFKQ